MAHDSIRLARQRAGINQMELAARLGVSQSAVSAWEVGTRNPSVSQYRAIAEALGCRLVDVLDPNQDIGDLEGYACDVVGGVTLASATLRDGRVVDRAWVSPSMHERHPSAIYCVNGSCTVDRLMPAGCYVLVDPDMVPADGTIVLAIPADAVEAAFYVWRGEAGGSVRLDVAAYDVSVKAHDAVPAGEIRVYGLAVGYVSPPDFGCIEKPRTKGMRISRSTMSF